MTKIRRRAASSLVITKIRRRTASALVAHVPHDVIALILERLPAKSLLRFMTVCKLWCSTIRDPKFTELHCSRSLTRPGGSYFASVEVGADKVTFIFNGHGRCKDVPIPGQLIFNKVFPSPIFDRFVAVSPILNGLICLHSDYDVLHAVILNITTSEILHLPETRLDGGHYITKHHIGYDPVTKKYKVLHIVNPTDEAPTSEVFTLGTNSWRYCPNTPSLIMKRIIFSPCLNGKIYWLVFERGDRFLITFDVGREVYNTSKFLLALSDLSSLFTDLEGNLAAVKFCGPLEGVEIWNLEHCYNNNHDGELKVVATRKIAFPCLSKYIRKLSVLGVSTNGEIVLTDDRSGRRTYYLDLEHYDSSKRAAWRIKDCKFRTFSRSEYSTCHFENMLRLKGPNY